MMTGRIRGVIAVVALSTDHVREMVPKRYRLVRQTLTARGTHPVVFGFGHQEHVRLEGRRLPGFPMSYHETFVGVPFLMREGATEPVYHMTALHLDNTFAVVGGQLAWGFAKQRARFITKHGMWQVRGRSGRLLADARCSVRGEWSRPDTHPHFAAISAMGPQTTIGAAAWGCGPDLCSTFDWRWSEARVRPADLDLTLGAGYAPALSGRLTTAGIDRAPHGSFEVDAVWRLSYPRLARTGWRRTAREIGASDGA